MDLDPTEFPDAFHFGIACMLLFALVYIACAVVKYPHYALLTTVTLLVYSDSTFFPLLAIVLVYVAYARYLTRKRPLDSQPTVSLSSTFCSIQNQSFLAMSKCLREKYVTVTADCNKIICQVPAVLKQYHGPAAEGLLRTLSEVKKEETKCKEYMDSKVVENCSNFAEISLDAHRKVFEEDCRVIDTFERKVEELRVLVSNMELKRECGEDSDSPNMAGLLSACVQFVLRLNRVDSERKTQTAKDVQAGSSATVGNRGSDSYHETAFESKSDVVRPENPMSSMSSNGSGSVPSSDNSQLRYRGVDPLTNAWNGSQSWDGPLLGTVSGDDVITRPPSVASSVTSQWSVVEDEEKEE